MQSYLREFLFKYSAFTLWREEKKKKKFNAWCVWISTIITFMMFKRWYFTCLLQCFTRCTDNNLSLAGHWFRCNEVIVTATFNSNGSFIKFTTLFSLNLPSATYQMLSHSLQMMRTPLVMRQCICIWIVEKSKFLSKKIVHFESISCSLKKKTLNQIFKSHREKTSPAFDSNA